MSKDRDNPEIFFVIGSLQVGGAEMHLSMVARELVKRGCAVTVYNLSGLGHLGESMQDAGVKIISPPVKSGTGILKILSPVCLGLSSLKLFLIFLFKRPKIVHFFLPQAYVIGAILARCAGLNRQVMSRRSLNFYQNQHPYIAWLERRLHGSMTAIIGNSRAVVAQLHRCENVPMEKLGLIYNGIELERFDAPREDKLLRKQLNIGADTIVMVIVANLIPYKGHGDLLEALSNIRGQMPKDWRLLVIGRDDGIGKKLGEQAAKFEIGKYVSFLGARSNIPEYLDMSDMAILCSHEEGFSNAILEGMAAGLPMVVTDVGGNSEAVVDGLTGIIVPARSPSELGAAILRLAQDAQLRKRMGARARKRVRQEFSLEACVQNYKTLYDAMGSGRKLSPESLSRVL